MLIPVLLFIVGLLFLIKGGDWFVETMTSGRVVPMDTTVAPISSSGRWNRRASADAPSTNQ